VGNATVSIVNQPSAAPGVLSIPLDVDFHQVASGVGSFTFEILYDGTRLDFSTIANQQLTGISVYEQTNPTRLVLDWVNPDFLSGGSTLESSQDGALLNMVFDYSGGTTLLEFNEVGCAMANNDNSLEVSVLYTDGQVTQNPETVVTISLPDLQRNPGTNNIGFPLTVTNFNNIIAFDFRVTFDPAVMEYVGITDYYTSGNPPLNASQYLINETAGELSISWVGDPNNPINLNNIALFNIVFNYINGTSDLAFDLANCIVSDQNYNEQAAIYNDGSISEPILYEATVLIPNLLATTGQDIDMPVYATGFTNLGAISFDIEFNPEVLSFSGITNINTELTGNGSAIPNVSGSHVYFEWMVDFSHPDGPDISDNDKLFDIRFNFKGGTSPLTFNSANCAVAHADVNVTPILVGYTDGSVYGGIVSLVKSTITANPVAITVAQSSTITVQLKDQLNNNLPASGGVVQLFTTPGSSLTQVTDNNDGTYSATFSPASSGIFTITGKLNNVDFEDDATVQVYYILTLEIAGNGKVKIGSTEYDHATQQINITSPTALLEAMPGTGWQLYSWKEGVITQVPRGASTYLVTMDADKTVLATFHLPGDANCSGSVTTADIVAITNSIKGSTPSPFCFENADVSLSGTISTADIVIIVQIIKQ
jgi:hypothetical protein